MKVWTYLPTQPVLNISESFGMHILKCVNGFYTFVLKLLIFVLNKIIVDSILQSVPWLIVNLRKFSLLAKLAVSFNVISIKICNSILMPFSTGVNMLSRFILSTGAVQIYIFVCLLGLCESLISNTVEKFLIFSNTISQFSEHKFVKIRL